MFPDRPGPDGKFHALSSVAAPELAGKSVFFHRLGPGLSRRAGVVSGESLRSEDGGSLSLHRRPPPRPASRRGAPAPLGDLRSGIQAISPSEFNIDRGVVDKILRISRPS